MKTDVYLRAAELIASKQEEYACLAIRCDDYSQRRNAFAKLFQPSDSELMLWFGAINAANRNHRVLALLFMHWIANDEE